MANLLAYLKNALGFKAFIPKKPSENLIRCQNSTFVKEYNFSEISISGIIVVIAEKKSIEKAKGTKLAKEYNSMKEYFDFLVLLSLPMIDNVARRLLIGNRINFVVPGHQLHFPDMYISLCENTPMKRVSSKHLTISAQVLLLYHLQKKSLAGTPFKEIAQLIGYTPKTISLAVTELQNFGIAKVNISSDKTKSLKFDKRGIELYYYIDKWLQSPVIEAGHTNKPVDTISSVLVGVAAWRHFLWNLSDFHVYGLTSKQAKERKIKVYQTDRKYSVQVWKYDPMLMAKDGYADMLSVLLSFIVDINGSPNRCYYEDEKKRVLERIQWADDENG